MAEPGQRCDVGSAVEEDAGDVAVAGWRGRGAFGDGGDGFAGFETEDEVRVVGAGGGPVEGGAEVRVGGGDVGAHVEGEGEEGGATVFGGPAEDAVLVHGGVEEGGEDRVEVAVGAGEGVEVGFGVEGLGDDEEELGGEVEEWHGGLGVLVGGRRG